MTTLNEHQFEKKLQYLKDSQESIQSLSSWCLQHRQHHKKIVSSWLRVMKKVKVEHRLTLFYLANDVIQYSKRKNYEFVESWGTALQRATPMVREDKVKHKIQRIFKIWNDRGVYDDSFVSDLCGLLSTQTKKSQPEPALVETEFQSSALFNLIRSCSQLDNETDTRLRKLKENPISVCDVDGICTILKDRRQGDDMVLEVDEGIGKMQAYVNALQSEIKEREQLIEQLEQAQIYYSSQYGEAKIVCNAYRNFGNRVKQLKRKLDELIPSLKDVSPLPSPDMNAPSPSPDSDIDLPEERNSSEVAGEEEGFTPEGQPIKTVTQDDSHSLDNCFTSFLGNAASLPFDLQKNLFGESSPRLALTPSPIHNLLEESGELPLLSLSSTSEGKPIEVISSRSKPDEGFSISDFFKNLSTNIPGLDGDGVGDIQSSPIVSKEESFASLPVIIDSVASRYEYSSVATTTSSVQLTDVASRYAYSAVITTPNTLPPLPPAPTSLVDSGSRYEYSAITPPSKQHYETSVKQHYEYPPVVMTPAAPPPPPPADVTMAQYDEYVPAISTNTIQATPSVPDAGVSRYDSYTPAITTPNVPPPPVKSVPRYDDYTPAISTPNIAPPVAKSNVPQYDEYVPSVTTPNVPPPPVKSSMPQYDYSPAISTSNVNLPAVKQYEGYTVTVTTTSSMQPPPPIPQMMESAVSRYEYPPAVTTPTPLQPPPLPPNLFPLDKYSRDEEEDVWGSKKDGAPSWSSKLPPKFPTWGDTPMESEWTPAMPVMPLDLDTPESPPMYEKEGFSDPVEYDEAGDVDHRTLVTLQLGDIDHRSLAHVGKKDVDHRPAGMRKKDVDHRNLISLTGSPLRDAPWSRTDQDYRTIPKPVAAVVPESGGEREADRDYRIPRPLGQELHDNVESVDMDLSDEEILEPSGGRRDVKPLVSFNITSPAKVLPSSPLHEKEDVKPRAPFLSAQRIPTIGGNVRSFRSRGAGAGSNFTRPPPLPRGFRPAPLAPPPPPPPQFLSDTDRFRTPPPQLNTPPLVIKFNAPNFNNRSPIRNNFSPHTRNFSTHPPLSGPPTPTKNTNLSYQNVKPVPQVKCIPSSGAKMPVSTASSVMQTERTLTQVKPHHMNSLTAASDSTAGMTRQATQQQNIKNSPDSAVETKQLENASQSAVQQDSKPSQSQISKSPVPELDSKKPSVPQSSQVTKLPQSPHDSRSSSFSQNAQTVRPSTAPQSTFQHSSTNQSAFTSKPPATPTSPVQNASKPQSFSNRPALLPTPTLQNAAQAPSFGPKPFATPTSPVQNIAKPPLFSNKPPTPTSLPQNNTNPPSFDNKLPSTPTSLCLQNNIEGSSVTTKPAAVHTGAQNIKQTPQLVTFSAKPSTVPTSFGQNITKPPSFGAKPTAAAPSSVQITARSPTFTNKPPTTPTSPVQNTSRPPLFATKPSAIPTSPVQNILRPPSVNTKPQTSATSPVQDTTKSPPSLNTKPPTTPTSPVMNMTKPPSLGTKPPLIPVAPVQNSSFGTKLPTTPMSPMQNITKPLTVGTKPLVTPTSPVQNTSKPPSFGSKPPASSMSPVQKTTNPPSLTTNSPSVTTSSVQNTTKLTIAVSQPQETQNTQKPFTVSREPTAVQSVASQNTDAKIPPPATKSSLTSTSSQNMETGSAVGDRPAQITETESHEAGPSNWNVRDTRPASSELANGRSTEYAGDGPQQYVAIKREYEDEPWMNDDIPEFESHNMDLGPRPKFRGLSRPPPRGRGRILMFSPRMRPPQWHGPHRAGPPVMRYPYRPPPPPPPPPPLIGMRPPRSPFRPPMFRGRPPRGRW